MFLKTENGFQQNYYFVEHNERKVIEELTKEFFKTVSPLIESAYKIVLDEYSAAVPKHLHWQMGNFLGNNLNFFVTCSLYCAYENRKLSEPDANNKEWLSLFASE